MSLESEILNLDDLESKLDPLLLVDASDSQKHLVESLTSGVILGAGEVERIDTHISHVFLSGNYVFKMKRALKLSFLDFSTLEARRIACEREVEINSKTAPDIYLGVVSVTTEGEGFALDGKGPVVDWLVKMKRFDDRTLFSRLVRNNGLKASLISDLAEQVGRFHLGAERRPNYGGYQAVLATINGVSDALEQFVGSVIERAELVGWRLQIKLELERQQKRLEMRRRMGFVRHCHGDLHLGNICLINGRPTLFDAIEFREDYASIDVLYDVAFPIMDLICNDRSELANLLLNRYLEVTCDYSGIRLLPLFLSLRAGIRAMVCALETRGAFQCSGKLKEARSYFELANRALVKSQPVLVAIGGYSGTGKSTLARRLGSELFGEPGSIVVRSDAIRKRIFRQPPLVPLPSRAYTPEVDSRVFREMCRDVHRALTAGWPVIVDATFMDPVKRSAIETLAQKKDVPFAGMWLSADPDILRERVAVRRGDVSDADNMVINEQLARDLGDVAWKEVNAGGAPEETAHMATLAFSSQIDLGATF